jgi:ABC-type dipeptide/oligopeptide/nickel transport system permease component
MQAGSTEPGTPPLLPALRDRRGNGPGAGGPLRRRRLTGFWRYAVQRALLIPGQLLFVLLILYVALNLPSALLQSPPESALAFLRGFVGTVVNDFTGNWGTGVYLRTPLPWSQIIADAIPTSLQLALFALPIAAGLAYPLSLVAGWSRRESLDSPARFGTLVGALLPAFVIATLVMSALFFSYLAWFGDTPSQGLFPSPTWFVTNGGFPSWVTLGYITSPTGLPLVDSLIHHDWVVAEISLTKTLLQAAVVAIAYVAIFFRHGRSIVRSVSEEPYITGARSRGLSERTLLWRHAARRVTPSFLLVFALTIPGYLGVQFAVEAAFVDVAGFGYLAFTDLTMPMPVLSALDPLIFLLAILVLVWTFAVDLVATRLDPRGVSAR